jgi:hypothetical protein
VPLELLPEAGAGWSSKHGPFWSLQSLKALSDFEFES